MINHSLLVCASILWCYGMAPTANILLLSHHSDHGTFLTSEQGRDETSTPGEMTCGSIPISTEEVGSDFETPATSEQRPNDRSIPDLMSTGTVISTIEFERSNLSCPGLWISAALGYISVNERPCLYRPHHPLSHPLNLYLLLPHRCKRQ